MNKRHPLDELFSQQLRDASASVPDDMWSRIARARQQKRRRLLVVWSSLGSSALMLLAAIWMYSTGPELGSFPLENNISISPGVDIAPPVAPSTNHETQVSYVAPLAQATIPANQAAA